MEFLRRPRALAASPPPQLLRIELIPIPLSTKSPSLSLFVLWRRVVSWSVRRRSCGGGPRAGGGRSSLAESTGLTSPSSSAATARTTGRGTVAARSGGCSALLLFYRCHLLRPPSSLSFASSNVPHQTSGGCAREWVGLVPRRAIAPLRYDVRFGAREVVRDDATPGSAPYQGPKYTIPVLHLEVAHTAATSLSCKS
nr:unnamed protein product [Digitaria exilis]